MLSKRLAEGPPLESLPRPPCGTPEGPAALPTESSPVLDARALGQLRQLDPKGENRLIERVLMTFQKSAARLVPQLAEARRTGDRATIRLVAHTFKSSAGSIGALTLAQCCAQAETAVCNENTLDLAPELDAMTAALAITLHAIAQRLDSSP